MHLPYTWGRPILPSRSDVTDGTIEHPRPTTEMREKLLLRVTLGGGASNWNADSTIVGLERHKTTYGRFYQGGREVRNAQKGV